MDRLQRHHRIKGGIPRENLLFYARDGVTDSIGLSTRTIYPLQYIQMDGTGVLTHDDLTATCAIIQDNGTSVLTAAASEITGTAGTVWSFSVEYDDNSISTYEFASLTATDVVVFDTSGNGRHLILAGFSDAAAAAVESLTVGSDWLNQKGMSAKIPELNLVNKWSGKYWTQVGNNTVENSSDGSVKFTYVDSETGGQLYLRSQESGVTPTVGRVYVLTGNAKRVGGNVALSVYSGGVRHDADTLIYSTEYQPFEIEFTCLDTTNTRLYPRTMGTGEAILVKDLNCVEKKEHIIPYAARKKHENSIKIGLFSDTHYSLDEVTSSNVETNIGTLTTAWAAAEVDVVFGCGDNYDGTGYNATLEEAQTDVTTFEGWLANANAPVYMATGNHDQSYQLTDEQFYSLGSMIFRNHAVDVGAWRVILYANAEISQQFSSYWSDLNYLKEQLAIARGLGKRVLIVGHTRINQDYPGSPPLFASPLTYEAGLITPSVLSGEVVLSSDTAETFTSLDIDKYIFLADAEGNIGGGIITGYTDDQTVTIETTVDFPSTTAMNWSWGKVSAYSVLAKETRAIINDAVLAGTVVDFVFSGHEHTGFAPVDPDGYGVTYVGVKASSNAPNGAILEITDKSFVFTGLGDENSYSGTLPSGNIVSISPTRVKYNLTVHSGTGPADWVVSFPAAPELIAALGLDSTYFDASGVPKQITWATHVDNEKVRFGDIGAVAYSVDQTATAIVRIDRKIGN